MDAPARLALRLELIDLYAAYAAAIDEGDLDAWVDHFAEPCLYKIVPRENHERGLPLATVLCESKAMLRDRVHAVRQTQMYAPRYVRHLVGAPRLLGRAGDAWRAGASYAVFETRLDQPTQILNVGRYLDLVVRDGDRLRFRERVCVFDSELVPTSLIYPV